MVRVKNRYIVAQLLFNAGSKEKLNDINARDIQMALREKISELYGDVGVGAFGNSTFVKFYESQHSKIFVVRTTRESQGEAHLALSCIAKIKDADLTVRSLVVHSCSRTCTAGLTTFITKYFDVTDLKGVCKDAVLPNILNNVMNVEL